MQMRSDKCHTVREELFVDLVIVVLDGSGGLLRLLGS